MQRFNVFGEAVFLNQCEDGKLMYVAECEELLAQKDEEIETASRTCAVQQGLLTNAANLLGEYEALEKQVSILQSQNKTELKWRGEMFKRLNKRARRQLIINMTLCVSLLLNLNWLLSIVAGAWK